MTLILLIVGSAIIGSHTSTPIGFGVFIVGLAIMVEGHRK